METLIITYPHRRDENGNPLIRIRTVKSSAKVEQPEMNKWFKYISSAAVRMLYANKLKS